MTNISKNSVLLFVILFFTSNNNIISQCNVEAFSNTVEICLGQSVDIWGQGGCGLLMYNDFNGGTPGSGWVATTGVNFTNPCGVGPDLIYLWMGINVPIPRTLTTVPFVVSTACSISFWLRFPVQTGNSGTTCEGPDMADEGVSLQYSVNNGVTWIDIAYFRPDGVICPAYPNSSGFSTPNINQQTAFTSWNQYSFPVPAGAASSNTIFRWRQHAYTDMDYDHWGLDVVEILCPGTTSVLWSHGPDSLNPPPVYPTQTTTYYVTVEDTINNLSAVDSITIVVNPGPVADFSSTVVCFGEETEFNDLSTPNNYPLDSWEWIFGVGDTSYLQNPNFAFNSTGSHDVTLIVEDEMGCIGEITKQVILHPTPQVQFSANPLEGCQPLMVSFLEEVQIDAGSNISDYLWDFGDGGSSNMSNPSYTYSNDGMYDVSLSVVSSDGCEETLTIIDYITVYPSPIANFSVFPNENYIYDPVGFFDQSVGATEWEWDFGNYNTSNEQNPYHTYLIPGNYLVSLYVENIWGCSHDISKVVNVQNKDFLYFPNAFSPNGDGKNDLFHPFGISWSSEGYEFSVYNRYGQRVFYTQDINTGWNGKLNNIGVFLPQGVYVYRIFLKALSGKEFVYEGSITLIY